MKTIIYEGHTIDINVSSWTGDEKVLYDGKEVSSRWSVMGATHVFLVTENGEDIQYEVMIGPRWYLLSWWCVVRRKGEIIYSDR